MHKERERMYDAVFDLIYRDEEKLDVEATKELLIFLDWIKKFQHDRQNYVRIFGDSNVTLTFNDFLRYKYRQIQKIILGNVNSMENKDLKEKQDLIKEYFKEYNERKKLNKTSKSEINTHYNPKNINYNINIETLSHSRQNVCFAQNIEKEM